MIISKIYKNIVIEKPKFTLLILLIFLLTFGYFSKNFQLDASSDTLLLENDPDLKYLREVNKKYGSKDFLVLTYTHGPSESFKSENTITKQESDIFKSILSGECDNFNKSDREIGLDILVKYYNYHNHEIKNLKSKKIIELLNG